MTENVNNIIEWQSHKEAAVTGLYKQLLEGNFLDTILFSSDGRFIKAHKVVLSAMSPVFEAMINMTKDKPGPAMLVLDKDVQFLDLQGLVEYIYTGTTVVPQDHMYSFLQLGHRFQVAGFNSQPVQEQRFEEPDTEAEIVDTISDNMMASEFNRSTNNDQSLASQDSATMLEQDRSEQEVTPAAAETTVPDAPSKGKRPRGRMPQGENVCRFCSKQYKTKLSCYAHETRVCNSNPDLKLYQCPDCNKSMKQSSKHQHQKKHSADSKAQRNSI